LVKEIIGRCQEQGLLLLNCGTYGNVIRWVPPLLVKREEIESALAIFKTALAASA
jgi:4-aminobutyrate aminotransferase